MRKGKRMKSQKEEEKKERRERDWGGRGRWKEESTWVPTAISI